MNGQGAGNGDINNDELSSFTSFGNSREGLDADTMNLFGSFTNDAGATSDLGAGIGDAGFGQMLTNDLSSFGVDLHSLEMSGSIAENSGVDLSSIQLMNLDEPPLGAGQMAGDAASMMANLLGTQQPNGNQNTEQPQGLGLPAVTGDNGKSRASSQSSDDMGDIPLAQLALMQQPAASADTGLPLNNMSAVGDIPGQISAIDAQIAAPMNATAAAPTAATAAMAPVSNTVATLSRPSSRANLADTAMQLDSTSGQIPVSATSTLLSMPGAPTDSGPSSALSHLNPLSTANPQDHGHQEPTNGTTGVTSTILLGQPQPNTPANANLHLDLHRPPASDEQIPLSELEKIENQLCSLLSTASRAIRILSGGENEGIQEAAGLKPTVREFMHTVAEVQAGLHVQHRKLVAERIPMKSAAAFHSDVAGFERDLVIWSDVAGLLARAIDSGLKLSSGEE